MKIKKVTTGFYKTKDVESNRHGLEERFAWDWQWEDKLNDWTAYRPHCYVRRYLCPEERKIVWVESCSLLYAVPEDDCEILEKLYAEWKLAEAQK